jgi:MFS family permease
VEQGAAAASKGRRAREYGLTAGTLGSSAGQTLMVVLLPVLLAQHTNSRALIGLVIAAEGFFALAVPYPIGLLSDRLPKPIAHRFGRRNAILLTVAPLLAVALAIVPFMESFAAIAAVTFAVFALLHAYRTPLWALMIDSVPESRWGRVEGVRGALHASGLGFAIVGGGLLYSIWPPLPFLIGSALIVAMTGVTFLATPDDSAERSALCEQQERDGAGHAHPSPGILAVLKERPGLRPMLIAHALWTGAVDGIRPFIFLFATVVLGITIAESSLLLLVLLLGLALGSVIIGRVGDRLGTGRVLMVAALLMGVAMASGIFVRSVPVAVAMLVPVGIAAAAFVSLPYPLFASFVGEEGMGRNTGIYSGATGLAHFFAPIIVGGAIDLGAPLFPEYDGLPLMWPIVGLSALLSVPMLHRALRQREAAGEG